MGPGLRLMGLGWYVVACIIVGVFGGLWISGIAGHRTLFTSIGALIGILVAFYGSYKMIEPLLKDNKEDTSKKPGDSI